MMKRALLQRYFGFNTGKWCTKGHNFHALKKDLQPNHHFTPKIRASRFSTATATKKKDNPNIFLDNLGTIFLSGIGLVIASLVRSYYGQNNKNQLRDLLEEEAAIDPVELNELRAVNQDLNFRKYVEIVDKLYDEKDSWTYEDFTYRVRESLPDSVQLGHLLDRVFLAQTDQDLPLHFYCVLLSLALNGGVPERIQALYHVLQKEGATVANVRAIVKDLQDTFQLPADTQIIPNDTKYPIQQYEKGTDLVEWSGSNNDVLDLDAFSEVLRSRAVCVWGECYHKKKF